MLEKELQPRALKVHYPEGAALPALAGPGVRGVPATLPEVDQGDLVVDSSNRHVHLSPEDFVKVFGPEAKLEPRKALFGLPMFLAPGFASNQTVTVRNPATGDEIRHLRVLGPARNYTQVRASPRLSESFLVAVRLPVPG